MEEEIRWRFFGGWGSLFGGVVGVEVEVEVEAEGNLAQGSFRGMLGPVWGVRCGVLWCAVVRGGVLLSSSLRSNSRWSGVTPSETARRRQTDADRRRYADTQIPPIYRYVLCCMGRHTYN